MPLDPQAVLENVAKREPQLAVGIERGERVLVDVGWGAMHHPAHRTHAASAFREHALQLVDLIEEFAEHTSAALGEVMARDPGQSEDGEGGETEQQAE